MTEEQLKPYKNREVTMLLHSFSHPSEWVVGTLVCIRRGEGRRRNYYLLHDTETYGGGNLGRDRRCGYTYDWAVSGDYSSDIMSHGIKPIKYMIKHSMT